MAIKILCDDCGQEITEDMDFNRHNSLENLKKLGKAIDAASRQVKDGTLHLHNMDCIINYIKDQFAGE
jgi:hypothetical protein